MPLERVLGEEQPDSERLPLRVLTEEVEHWCARGRVESWQRLLNPNSLHDDIQDTLTELGPALMSDLEPSVGELAAAAGCLQGKPAPTVDQNATLRRSAGVLQRTLDQALRYPPNTHR